MSTKTQKRTRLLLAVASVISACSVVAVTMFAVPNAANLVSSTTDENEIEMSAANSPTLVSGAASEVVIATKKGNKQTSFDYAGAVAYVPATGFETGHVSLADKGTISAHTKIAGLKAITVVYHGDGTLKAGFGSSIKPAAVKAVTSGARTGVSELEDRKFAFFTLEADGNVNIVTIRLEYECTAETSDITAPVISFAGDKTTIESLRKLDSVVTLPGVTAVTSDGEPLEWTVEHKLNGTKVDETYVTTEQNVWDNYVVGAHTYVFKAVDPDFPDLVTTKTLTYNVYQPIVSNWNDGNAKINDEWSFNPNVTSTNSDNSVLGLYTVPSQLYYGECVFSGITSAVGNIGMLHVKSSSATGGMDSWHNDNLDISANQHKLGTGWSDTEDPWIARNIWTRGYATTSDKYKALNASFTSGSNKIAVARSGDTYFLFLNDVLVDAHSYAAYHGIDTKLGLYRKKPGSQGGKVDGFKFIDGAAATAKINALLSGDSLFLAARDDWSTNWAPKVDVGFNGVNSFKWNTNNTGDDWQACTRSRVIVDGRGSAVDFDMKYTATNGDWWGQGFQFITKFDKVNETGGSIHTDAGCDYAGVVLNYHGGTFFTDDNNSNQRSAVGNPANGYRNRDTKLDATEWTSKFTRDTKYHFHIELNGTSQKYVISDANDSSKSITKTVTGTASAKYYYHVFCATKSCIEITNYAVTNL